MDISVNIRKSGEHTGQNNNENNKHEDTSPNNVPIIV